MSQPVLCEDFIIDPWQIYLAQLHQADVIVLMLSILDDNTYRELVAVAHSLQMCVLTEVISDEERLRAEVTVISESGINHYRQVRELSHYANGF